jgi:glycosyltransferase involved in cell wall biosynthesis
MIESMSDMKVAFVYDRVTKYGGAERILVSLHEIWPNAPLYTAIYNPHNAQWAKIFDVRTPRFPLNMLSIFPHEILPTFTPYAFEQFSFTEYDVVISITSAEAKGIVTSSKTLHVCYCLTPIRYLWSGYRDYLREPGLGLLNQGARIAMKLMFTPHRLWDAVVSNRPDAYVAISRNVAKRIQTYYHREASIIYPPVNVETFSLAKSNEVGKYFLMVARLVPYKKIDYVIRVCTKYLLPLVVIGRGIDESRLRAMAGSSVTFVTSHLTDKELSCYYRRCIALIFPNDEDFGIAAAEAQSCGKPVVAYRNSGVQEIIRDLETGILYDREDEKDLLLALTIARKKRWNPQKLRNHASQFSRERFKMRFKREVSRLWKDKRDIR